MKKINTITCFLIGFVISAVPTAVLASKITDFGLKTAGETSGLTSNEISQSGSIAGILGTLIGVLLSFVGVFFFLMMLVGGFTWMTAQGSSEKVEAAKKRMISASIGLVIVLFSYAIGNYVFSNFLGGSTTTVASDCKTKADGVDCGDNMVCQKNKCVEQCGYVYSGAECVEREKCTGDSHVATGYCPGGESNICCVSDAVWKDVINTTGNTETSKPSCNSVGGLCISIEDSCLGSSPDATCGKDEKCCVEGCTQQGGKCMAKSMCTSNEGKVLSAACETGNVCCQTCTSLGGFCLYGNSASNCEGKTMSGICPADNSGVKGACCLGTYNYE